MLISNHYQIMPCSRILCSSVKTDFSLIYKQRQLIQSSWKTRCLNCRGLYCSLKSISRVKCFPLSNLHRIHYQALSSDTRKPTTGSDVKRSDILDKILNDRKKQLFDTQQRLRQTQLRLRIARLKLKETRLRILQDIRDTRSMMKERMEEVIERENIWTIPNILCVTRILSSPYLGYLIIQSDFNMALGFLAVAGVSDALDGWIARTWKSQSSKLGSFLDPMADKVLIATLFLSLTYVNLIPVYLTALIIVRDMSLVIAAMIVRYRSLPPPRTMSRYFDATHATAQLAPTTISKFNTMVQLSMVATTLAAPVFGFVDHHALQALWYVTAGTTVASALSYIFSKDTYKYLKRKKKR